MCALCSVVTWTGVSKPTPPSLSRGSAKGVVAGLGLRLELDTPEEELAPIPLSAPGIVGMAPGSRVLGLITRLAWT